MTVPLHAPPAGFHIVEMDAIPLAVRKDGLGCLHQAVRFLSPAQVIRYLDNPNAEVAGDALDGRMCVHVPFGGVKIVLDILSRREIPLVILERLDHRRPRLGRDIRGLRQRLDALDYVGVSLGVE